MATLSPRNPPLTLSASRVAWLPSARSPAWRRAAVLGPPRHQRLSPAGPRDPGSPTRWLLRPLPSLTDDDEERPLAPPRLPAARPRGQGSCAGRSGGPAAVAADNVGPTPWSLLPQRAGSSSDAAGPDTARVAWKWRQDGAAGCIDMDDEPAAAAAGASGAAAAPARWSINGVSVGGGRSYTNGPDSGGGGGNGGGDREAASGGGGGGGGKGGEADGSSRSPERVVSDHVGRQRSAAPGQLDPVGARDDGQQPGASTKVDATPGSLPPLDSLRPPPPGAAAPGGGGRASWGGADSATEDEGGGGRAPAVPSWVGQTVWAVPCSTVGYGTRAEVVSRLPASIMLLRHAECMTLDDLQAHERVPNHDIPLSECGVGQARLLGERLRPALQASGMRLYMYTSPFLRCSETARLLAEELAEGGLVSGVREAVQLREQDWGNFQDPRLQAECKAERLRYGRFYYRFPSGESVADVYDRLTIFQDHLVRDMCAGRFSENTCVAIVSHGLTLRVFAMRWMHWTVRQFLQVYNIPNAEPVVLHKDVHPSYLDGSNADLPFLPHHTKCLYRLTPRALDLMRGADASMATSNSCWHAQGLGKSLSQDSHEEDRQWADVDGMV